MKVELDANQLNIIVTTMRMSQIKGSDAIVFGKLLERLTNGLEKEMTKEKK